jgi:hypothetical protein
LPKITSSGAVNRHITTKGDIMQGITKMCFREKAQISGKDSFINPPKLKTWEAIGIRQRQRRMHRYLKSFGISFAQTRYKHDPFVTVNCG